MPNDVIFKNWKLKIKNPHWSTIKDFKFSFFQFCEVGGIRWNLKTFQEKKTFTLT
jgi:hypothetical protein